MGYLNSVLSQSTSQVHVDDAPVSGGGLRLFLAPSILLYDMLEYILVLVFPFSFFFFVGRGCYFRGRCFYSLPEFKSLIHFLYSNIICAFYLVMRFLDFHR